LKTTTIRLDDELYERLEVIARIEGRPVADAVREAVKEFIEGRFHNEGFIGKAEEMAEQVNQFMRAAREVKKKPQGTNAA
jgi:predicted DNA-binding protein